MIRIKFKNLVSLREARRATKQSFLLLFCFIFIIPSLCRADSASCNGTQSSLDSCIQVDAEEIFPNLQVDAEAEFSNLQPDAEKKFPNLQVDAEEMFPALQPDAEKLFCNK